MRALRTDRCCGSRGGRANRMALPHRGGEAGVAMQRIARLVDRQRHDVELDVGAAALRVLRAGRAADLAGADGQRPAAVDQPVPAHARQAQRIAHVVVERVARLQPDDGARLVVVLQVLADAGQIGNDCDAVLPQQAPPDRCRRAAAAAATAARRPTGSPRARRAPVCVAALLAPIRRRRRACLRARCASRARRSPPSGSAAPAPAAGRRPPRSRASACRC